MNQFVFCLLAAIAMILRLTLEVLNYFFFTDVFQPAAIVVAAGILAFLIPMLVHAYRSRNLPVSQ